MTARSRRQLLALFPAAAAVLGLAACSRSEAPQGAGARVVDLTHTLTHDFPYIPVPGLTFPFESIPIATVDRNGVAANRWVIHEHIGTQVDAPSHFDAAGKPMDQVPIDDLVAPLAVVDLRTRTAADPDTEVTRADILDWEREHGRLPDRSAVFLYSGWESRLHDSAAFINADAGGAMHFPGFSVQAAEFLLRERNVVGLGVDTLSLDPGRDKDYRTHKVWLGAGKWAVECVANLGSVPASGATVIVGAPKVAAATGGPARILAMI
ncbi:MAG: cyclase family protein [Mycobacteriaceae bacterium]|nr:cyclase family protein [Mycobacteriaceae bacterium]